MSIYYLERSDVVACKCSIYLEHSEEKDHGTAQSRSGFLADYEVLGFELGAYH